MAAATVDMGPVISAQHRDNVASYLDIATKEGAERGARRPQARFARPTAFCSAPAWSISVKPGMRLAKEEIFGPVLSVVRAEQSRRSPGHRPRLRIRQRRLHFHPQRLGRPRVQAALQRRHDRHQRRRARPDGLVPLHRLEQIVLRRPAHPGHRKHPVLHAAKDDADPLVQIDERRYGRPGVEDEVRVKMRCLCSYVLVMICMFAGWTPATAAEKLSASCLLAPADYAKFSPGKSKKEILQDLQWRGNFEMSTRHDGHDICAIDYGINGGFLSDNDADVWAIFIDGKFEKFVEPPAWDKAWDNTKLKIGNFDWLIRATESPSVNLVELEKKLKSDHVPSHVDPGLTAVAVALAPALAVRQQNEMAKNADLRNQFNAARLELGMNENEIQTVLGSKAIKSGDLASGNYKVYGSRESIDLTKNYHFSNVLVIFSDDKVSGIYSGSLLPGGDAGLVHVADGYIYLSTN